ncbi:unnamed protein product [Brassicogethes aeneus]|uniref:Polycystin cation channel PKD1/PKD2 domain-containing protein n=1 Tax=Brassicogethes aeneus TaxID=1431903 RepID=A0A9P0FCA2_BRAAE|nr:unnamed protein product [Brassicogethes aeneus]
MDSFFQCSFGIVFVNVYKLMQIREVVEELETHPDHFVNFDALESTQGLMKSLEAILMFIVYLKFFKFLDVSRSLSLLQLAFVKCIRDIFAFSILFFLVMVAFAFWGHLLFGRQLKSYYTFGDSIFTLLKAVLSDFNYEQIEDADYIMAPIFFTLFMIIVFFILLNMLLAIINDSYSLVLEEQSQSKQEMLMLDFLKPKILRMLKFMKINFKIRETKSLSDYDKTVDQITEIFKKCHFSDVEIDMFFKRYNIDDTSRVKNDDIEYLLGDLDNPLEPLATPLTQNDEDFVKFEDFERYYQTQF